MADRPRQIALSKVLAVISTGALALGGCALPGPMRLAAPDPYFQGQLPPDDGGFANIGYAEWTNAEPSYRLYPGDTVEVTIPSAPEYNTTAEVKPDGRITLKLVGELMAANRSLEDIRAGAEALYKTQLLRPQVDMTVKAQPLRVFVGGEVGTPGAIDMTGDMNAFQAIVQAGSFKTTADIRRVIIIRRGENGLAMMRTANLAEALRHGNQPDMVPLRRMDVIYVPRSGIANVALLMQQYFRDILPLPGSFSYAVNGFSVSN